MDVPNYLLILQEYQLTEVYWHILAARLAFVVLFQNVVGVSVMALKWVVPSMAMDLRQRIRREAYLTNEIIIRNELLKAKGVQLQDQVLGTHEISSVRTILNTRLGIILL